MPVPKVDGLRGDVIDEISIPMDWESIYGSYPDGIDTYTVEICDKCDKPVLTSSMDEEEHRGFIFCDDNCRGMVPGGSAPAMNFLYPLPEEIDHREVIQEILKNDKYRADRLSRLPLCLVVITSDTFPILSRGSHGLQGLALTGGGMDLSWEICEYYTLLGYLPPAHHCVLPSYADRKTSATNKSIISACKASLKCVMRRASYNIGNLREVSVRMREMS